MRNDDKDLHDLIESLPNQVGSDIIRAILRDGLESQRQSNGGNAPMSHLSMLCQLRKMNIDEVIRPFFADDMQQPDMPPSPAALQISQGDNTSNHIEVERIPVINIDASFDMGANDTEY